MIADHRRSPLAKTNLATRRPALGRSKAGPLELVSGGLALGAIMAAPLPFGSVETPWIALWISLIGVSLLTASYAPPREVRLAIMATLAVYAVIVGVVLLQAAGLGAPDSMREEAARLLGEPLNANGRRDIALLSLGTSLLPVLAFVRVALFASAPGRAALTVHLVGIAGLAYAVFAAAALLIDPTVLLWREKTAYLGSLTGTFVNRNTAATFFGTVTLVWWVKLCHALLSPRLRGIGWRDLIWLAMGGHEMRLVGLSIAACFSLAATAATGSRAGFVLTLAAMAAASLMLRPGRIGPVVRSPAAWIGAAAAILLIEWLGDRVADRLMQAGLMSEGRLSVFRAVLGLVAEHPWLGVGMGQFEHVFPAARPSSLPVIGLWDRVHSTPLETAVELGLPAFGAISALWCALLWRIGVAAVRRSDPVLVTAAAVGLLATLHAFVDFSLQIPGYAVIFAALLGAGVGGAAAPETTRRRSPRPDRVASSRS